MTQIEALKANNASLIREIDEAINEWESAAVKATERKLKLAHLHIAKSLKVQKAELTQD